MNFAIDPLIAAGVFVCTAVTDAAYVFFAAAIVARKRWAAANWSGVWYLLSAFAVISYTQNAVYIAFAAIGSWVGAFVTVNWLHQRDQINAPASAPASPRRDPSASTDTSDPRK